MGNEGVTELANGNYVIASRTWSSFTGAVTVVNGATGEFIADGTFGAVSAANSIVGDSATDQVGRGVTALDNGNFVISSPIWADVGAVTLVSGDTGGFVNGGGFGAVSAANSIVGQTADDQIGLRVADLGNGNFVIGSQLWDNGAVNVGAATLVSGVTGELVVGGGLGPISDTNSLVGTTFNDQVGKAVTALANGNYVVASPGWDNGATNAVGAVTWGNGTTGITDPVSGANSLVGASANFNVGDGGVTALTNGNYVISSLVWNGDRGAVTWGNGSTGTTGVVSAANSLVGTAALDEVGLDGVTALTNGNYVVGSHFWDGGGTSFVGAVTWGDGTTGITGEVSAANSLVGTTSNDRVGDDGITALTNGNYVVASSRWDNGGTTNVGAATWGDGATGITGPVSGDNSLVGTAADDSVATSGLGANSVTALVNGNYVVGSAFWDGGGPTSAVGAVTVGDGTTGTTGAVTETNSLVGTTVFELLSSDGVVDISGDTFAVRSAAGGGGIDVVSFEGTTPSRLFGEVPADGATISASAIATTLAGANLTLQANNDITLEAGADIESAGGRDLTIQAGRSVILDADIDTGGGDLTIIANELVANGAIDAQRSAGAALITMADGTSLDTGGGKLTLRLRSDPTKVDNTSGDIALEDINAGTLVVENLGTGSDITTASPDAGIVVTGNTTLSSVNGSIELSGAQNDFIGTVSVTQAADVTLADSNTLELGAVDATGALDLTAATGVTFTGDLDVDGGGTLTLGGNPLTIDSTGRLTVTGGTSTVSGTLSLPGVVLTGGTLDVTGALAVSEALAWTGGTLSGGASILAGASLAVGGGADKTLAGSLINDGTVSVTGAAGLTLDAGAVLINNNVVLLQSDAGLGGTGTLTNAGVLRKSAGTGTSLVGAVLSNTGTVDVDSGTLEVAGNFTNAGTVDVTDSASFAVSAPFVFVNNAVIQGNGTVRTPDSGLRNNATLRPGASPGRLTIIGDLFLGSGSVLEIELGRTDPGPPEFDIIKVTGAVTLGGGLSVVAVNGFAPLPQSLFEIITCGAGCSGVFATVPAQFSTSVMATAVGIGLASPVDPIPNVVSLGTTQGEGSFEDEDSGEESEESEGAATGDSDTVEDEADDQKQVLACS